MQLCEYAFPIGVPLYTVFHKIGTPLYFFNNILPCGPISIIDIQTVQQKTGVKVNGQYYRDILLRRYLLPDIKQYSDYFTFQQDGAPAHRAHETVELLKVKTPDFIPPNLWPPNSPDLNPVDYKIWGVLQNGFTRQALKMLTSYDAGLMRNGTSWNSA